MDNISESLGFDNLQEMDPQDRANLLSCWEHAALGSSKKVAINGRELNVVEDVKSLEGDSILLEDAYVQDPHALLTPTRILSEGEKVKKTVIGGRAGKKVGGNITMFGVQGVLASMQGVEMGIIPQNVGDNNEVAELHVYLAKAGKQIMPSEIGADKWDLSPSFSKIAVPVMINPKGTMIFTAKPTAK